MTALTQNRPEPRKKIAAPLDQPSRGTVEALFRELTRDRYDRMRDRESRRLYKELEALKKRLLDVPEVREAEKLYEETREREQDEDTAEHNRIRRVRALYQAHGLTARVKKEIQDLVDWVNSLSE